MLVFGVLLVVCGISVGVSEAFKHDRTTTATIDRHIERVVVRAGTGKVHLEGSESQRVMVREQLQWLWRRPVVHTSVRGATLVVSGSCPDTGPVNRCKADIDLAIPFDADVVVQGDSGDISAERLAGHLKLTTDSGDVRAQDLNAISVAATTNAGDVDVAFATQPVSVSANSNSGDVLVTGRFPTAVDFGDGVLASAGSDDVFVARMDYFGSPIWSNRFGDAPNTL